MYNNNTRDFIQRPSDQILIAERLQAITHAKENRIVKFSLEQNRQSVRWFLDKNECESFSSNTSEEGI